MEIYSCTTSDPVRAPVFVTMTDAVTSMLPFATLGAVSSNHEYSKVVYDRPCLARCQLRARRKRGGHIPEREQRCNAAVHVVLVPLSNP